MTRFSLYLNSPSFYHLSQGALLFLAGALSALSWAASTGWNGP